MSRKDHKKKKKWPWIVGGFGLIVIAVLVYGLMIYMNLTKTAKEMHEPIDRELSDKREEAVVFKDQEPFSMLVLGVDERAGDSGRSDTMIVMTVNPEIEFDENGKYSAGYVYRNCRKRYEGQAQPRLCIWRN